MWTADDDTVEDTAGLQGETLLWIAGLALSKSRSPPLDEIVLVLRHWFCRPIRRYSQALQGRLGLTATRSRGAKALAPGYFRTELNKALVEDEKFSAWLSARTPLGRWGDVQELTALSLRPAQTQRVHNGPEQPSVRPEPSRSQPELGFARPRSGCRGSAISWILGSGYHGDARKQS